MSNYIYFVTFIVLLLTYRQVRVDRARLNVNSFVLEPSKSQLALRANSKFVLQRVSFLLHVRLFFCVFLISISILKNDCIVDF